MSGIYIHIPFCRNACSYCDFHFTICHLHIEEMISALVKELEIRKDYLDHQVIRSLYLGGGTPSLLKKSQLARLFEAVYKNFQISQNPEITLEANPEDVTKAYVKEIIQLGVNRLSIGIQSFFDEDLYLMNRVHDSERSEQSIIVAREEGINNLNIDLIYGLPGLKLVKWRKNLAKTVEYKPEHVSAYHLTYEPGTTFYYKKMKRRIKEPDEEESVEQFKELVRILKAEGYIHYEISNFARKGFISVHNSGYWTQRPYIGIGPSAHSFNGWERQWNISKNMSYIRGVNKGAGYFETEMINNNTKYHDYVMTSLRTIWGTDLMYILNNHGKDYYHHFMKYAGKFLKTGDLKRKGNKIYLTKKGIFVSDHIIRDLFME